jgi:urease subunit beta
LRFEPGDQREVTLVPFGGKQRLYGFNSLVDGWARAPISGFRPSLVEAERRAEEFGFRSSNGKATAGPAKAREPAAAGTKHVRSSHT